MAARVLTIVGAGSLRCAPPLLASIAAPRFEHALEIRLYDANLERLDLMGRLLDRMLVVTRSEHEFAMHANLGPALRGSDAVVVCMTEDCARRMTGKTATRVLFPSEPVETNKLVELGRGDMNKPTPFNELSPMTLAALSTPEGEGLSREKVIADALAQTVERVEKSALVVNLTRGVAIPRSMPHLQLNWPEPLEEGARGIVPHRILRWIDGDYELDRYVEDHRESPMVKWLVSDFGAL